MGGGGGGGRRERPATWGTRERHPAASRPTIATETHAGNRTATSRHLAPRDPPPGRASIGGVSDTDDILDPQLADILAITPPEDLATRTPATARERLTTGIALVDSLVPGQWAELRVDDLVVDGGEGPIPARRYRPQPDGPTATVVFFHGGGWVCGDLASYDRQARELCGRTGATVLSVEYRLAPEHSFPAGLDDCLAALGWAAANLAELGGADGPLAVAGDSAGGNLAAVVAQKAAGEGVSLAAQLLLYPVTDAGGRYAEPQFGSLQQFADGYFLTLESMQWYAEQYLSPGDDGTRPEVSPLRATDLTGLPPAVVATARFDPLRDEGDAYAAALAAAGVDVHHHRGAGLVHGYFGAGPVSAAADAEIAAVCAAFAELLAEPRART